MDNNNIKNMPEFIGIDCITVLKLNLNDGRSPEEAEKRFIELKQIIEIGGE